MKDSKIESKTELTSLQVIFCSNVLTYTDEKDVNDRPGLRFFKPEEESAVRWFFKHIKPIQDQLKDINTEKTELWNKLVKETREERKEGILPNEKDLEEIINEKQEAKDLIKKEMDWYEAKHNVDLSEKTKSVLVKYVSEYKPTAKDLNLKFEVLEALGVAESAE